MSDNIRAAAERMLRETDGLDDDILLVCRFALAHGGQGAEVERLRAAIDTAAAMLYRLGRKLDGQDGWYDLEIREAWVALVNELQPLRAQPAPSEGTESRSPVLGTRNLMLESISWDAPEESADA